MFLACHLFVGVLIGILLADRFRDRRLLPIAAAGALLPDLIDKPLGHLLLADSIDDGRIYMHGLFIVFFLLLAGILLWRERRSFVLLALALGILSHQILDAMWEVPVSWFYPLFGPYQAGDFPDFFAFALWSELASLSEWVFAIVSAVLLVLAYRDLVERRLGSRPVAAARRAVPLLVPLLAGLGCAAMLLLVTGSTSEILMVGDTPETNLLLMAVGLGGAVLLRRRPVMEFA